MSKQNNKQPSQFYFCLLLCLFFLSGCSALIYETLWQRMMILVFGASAPATTAILAAFFCGIAFGSYLGGKALKRIGNTLACYGWLELWIAAWGLAVPGLLTVADALYVRMFQETSGYLGNEPGALLSLFYRFGLSILVVLPATLGMGATIPVMNRLLVERGRTVGRGVALAYGFNTIGAVLGCLVTGFFLLRELGVQNSLYVAAGVNSLVVATALWTARRSREHEALIREACEPDLAQTEEEFIRYPVFLVFIYFCMGFLALGYEILWFRILAIYNTNSLITFTLILSIYLLGFSTGSIILFPFLARRMKGLTVLILSNFGTAFFALFLLPVVYKFPDMIGKLILAPANRETLTFVNLVSVEALFSSVMVFLPTLFMGLAYPALCQALIPRKEVTAEYSGLYYFIGTLGSMSGVALVGFFVIPALGLVGCLASLCAGSLVLAIVTGLVEMPPSSWGKILLQTCSGLLLIVAISYGVIGHPFTTRGHLVYAQGHWQVLARSDSQVTIRFLRYKSGRSGTVSVEEVLRGEQTRGPRRISVDGQLVAATDMHAKVDAKMLAHLPLLLHPKPKHALTVGFGSGGTSWSMTRHKIAVDCVEIEPEVPLSADLFREQNHGIQQEPNFHLILNDARDHLHGTRKRYDAISTDATNLQYKQNGNLYTREYFELMKLRLTETGIACAWVPLVDISEREFKILLKTFAAVYEHPSVWMMNHTLTTFAIFIATPTPLSIDLNRLQEGFDDPDIGPDLEEIEMTHPFQFVHCLLLDEDGVRRYVGNAPLHTDDRPVLEFSSPVNYYQRNETGDNNLWKTLRYRPQGFRQFVKNINEKDVALFETHGRVSQLWSEVTARYLSYYPFGSPQMELKNLEEAFKLGKEASQLLPASQSYRDLMERLVRRIKRTRQRSG